MSGAAWIAADWGTTNLRLWAFDAAGALLAERQSDRGMGRLAPDGYEPALMDLVGDLLDDERPVPVLICGMAGARQGWQEAAYRPVPCAPGGAGAIRVATRHPRLDVRILPGLSQAAPADVMRGEETQIAGFLDGAPGFDGILCLPGTHSKWVRVCDGRVESFRTCMTGEVFALLAEHSVLRHSLDEEWDDDAFDAALAGAVEAPEALPLHLFPLRAEALLSGQAPGVARARLSGLLIGAELAALRGFWQGHEVVLIGEARLAGLYARGLAALDVPTRREDAARMTLRGLQAARADLEAP